jgi:hypothetical protein
VNLITLNPEFPKLNLALILLHNTFEHPAEIMESRTPFTPSPHLKDEAQEVQLVLVFLH